MTYAFDLALLRKLPKRVQCCVALLDGRFWWDWKVCKLRVRRKIAYSLSLEYNLIRILLNFCKNYQEHLVCEYYNNSNKWFYTLQYKLHSATIYENCGISKYILDIFIKKHFCISSNDDDTITHTLCFTKTHCKIDIPHQSRIVAYKKIGKIIDIIFGATFIGCCKSAVNLCIGSDTFYGCFLPYVIFPFTFAVTFIKFVDYLFLDNYNTKTYKIKY